MKEMFLDYGIGSVILELCCNDEHDIANSFVTVLKWHLNFDQLTSINYYHWQIIVNLFFNNINL